MVFELCRYFLVFSDTGVGGWGHSAEVRILITVMASTLLRPARPAQRWTIESEDPPKWFWNWDVQWDQAALLNYWEDFPTVKLQPTCSSQSDLRQWNNSAGGSDHINLPVHSTRHSNFNTYLALAHKSNRSYKGSQSQVSKKTSEHYCKPFEAISGMFI